MLNYMYMFKCYKLIYVYRDINMDRFIINVRIVSLHIYHDLSASLDVDIYNRNKNSMQNQGMFMLSSKCIRSLYTCEYRNINMDKYMDNLFMNIYLYSSKSSRIKA
jgi:hypothetical protein